ncbi:3-hydroxyacyl-CoA dehydrogenase [Rhodobacterales bacterium HKCCD6035]|nr:3-hydroxyacyl-CoA dehydrogenase [Rhodobacterales bacterium HKCCD6035]
MGKIAIVGAGLIGQAWGAVFVAAGHSVVLYDPIVGAADGAAPKVLARLQDLADHGLIAAQEYRSQVSVAASLAAALEGVIYVQESGPENRDVKAALTAEMDAILPPDVPIGSSTSGITASSYAADVAGRARCLVVHPINPPHLVPAVEIVPAPFTAAEVTQKVRDLIAQTGQIPITLKREIDGFVVNRLQGALLIEAFKLLQNDVAAPEDIDRAICDGLGMRWSFMGPFETIHLNAPGGVSDYVTRFAGMYQTMFEGDTKISDWSAALDQGLTSYLDDLHPQDSLPEAHRERDLRLMDLLRARRAGGRRG